MSDRTLFEERGCWDFQKTGGHFHFGIFFERTRFWYQTGVKNIKNRNVRLTSIVSDPLLFNLRFHSKNGVDRLSLILRTANYLRDQRDQDAATEILTSCVRNAVRPNCVVAWVCIRERYLLSCLWRFVKTTGFFCKFAKENARCSRASRLSRECLFGGKYGSSHTVKCDIRFSW